MTVLKCNVCGGECEVNQEMSIAVCKFCDSTMVIPKELDRKGSLYNRAVFLRQNNQFDKAVSVYEEILKEDNSDAEAHWGLVLSKYGIEYVVDPRTNERIPTCHRTQPESILSDLDYKAAIEYADMDAQRVIEKEAKRIREIQEKIFEISRKEPPYDIFICYKENDDFGNRTEDSILAQELYYELVKKGYQVFFARKTLESKLGAEYEPVIYAALNSAKVMIVLGTQPEHFRAVWVRNEWSRFLKMSKDSQKVIIPAYRGMSPYELPDELSAFQSQDMSKIGFMQDLTDGIERYVRKEVRKQAVPGEIADVPVADSLERLLQNGQTYLELKSYASAEEFYTTVTKKYPEDYRGWWGLILSKTHEFTEVMSDQTELNRWFGYVKQLAEAKEFEELESSYVVYTEKVSVLAAAEDMERVESTINDYNSRIRGLQDSISEINKKLSSRTGLYQEQCQEEERMIRNCEEIISAQKSNRASWTRTMAIGGAMILGGVILVLAGFLWGIVIGIIGAVVCKSAGRKSEIEEKIADEEKRLQKAQNAKVEHKAQYDRNVSDYNAKIEKLNGEIAAFQEKIAACKKYLELGEDKISEFWFSEKCRALGVQKNYDSQVHEYRKAIFDV